ncbi:MAG: hypothetical protein AAF583_00370 [Pseudomonadota bacterium]
MLFSAAELDRFEGLSIPAAQAEELLSRLNEIDIPSELLRLAVLYTEAVSTVSKSVHRYFVRRDLQVWNSLSPNARTSASARIWCGTDLFDRLAYEGIRLSLSELEALTLQLNLRSAPHAENRQVHSLYFDVGEAVEALQNIRSKA